MQVHGQGTRLFGDGLAFWYTKEHSEEGPVFGNRDRFTGLGVFFDTYSNVRQGHSQYVSVMVGDGTLSYDHDADGGAAKIAGCKKRFRGGVPDSEPAWAKIVHEDGLLRVYLDINDEGWEECLVLRRMHLPLGCVTLQSIHAIVYGERGGGGTTALLLL